VAAGVGITAAGVGITKWGSDTFENGLQKLNNDLSSSSGSVPQAGAQSPVNVDGRSSGQWTNADRALIEQELGGDNMLPQSPKPSPVFDAYDAETRTATDIKTLDPRAANYDTGGRIASAGRTLLANIKIVMAGNPDGIYTA